MSFEGQGAAEYRRAFLAASTLFLVGVMGDIMSGGAAAAVPPWPVNLLMFGAFGLSVGGFGALARDSAAARFLGGVAFGTASLALIAMLAGFAGVLPQTLTNDTSYRPWYGRVVGSWPFAVAVLAVAVNLVVAMGRRAATRIRRADWSFWCVHGGLLMTLAAMVGGSVDQRRVRIVAPEGEPARAGFMSDDLESRYPVKLPFVVKVTRFHREEYPPRVAVLDEGTGGIAAIARRQWIEVSDGGARRLGPFVVDVVSYRAAGAGAPGGAAASARVRVVDTRRGATAAGGATRPREAELTLGENDRLALGDGLSLALIPPDPKRFRSDVVITRDDGDSIRTAVEVNRPVKVGPWRLYQSSYEARSSGGYVSVLEAISDPWLPWAYVGFALTLLGVSRLLWTGMGARTPRRMGGAP